MQAVSGEQSGTGSAGEQNTPGICSSDFHEVRVGSTHRAVTSPGCCLSPVPESDQQQRGTATPQSNARGEFLLPKGRSGTLCLSDTLTLGSDISLQGKVTLAGCFLSCALEVGSDAPASSAVLENMNFLLLTHLSDDLLYF